MKCVQCGDGIDVKEVRRIYSRSVIDAGCCSSKCLVDKSQASLDNTKDESNMFPKITAMYIAECIGCGHRRDNGKGFCYMFEEHPEKLPCAQHTDFQKKFLKFVDLKLEGWDTERCEWCTVTKIDMRTNRAELSNGVVAFTRDLDTLGIKIKNQ